MRNFFKLFLIASLISISSQASIDQIIYETYAGECLGECRSILRINSLQKELCFHDIKKTQPRCVTKPWKQKNDFEILLKLTPKSFFDLPATVGTPDAYDQGGIRLEVTGLGKSHNSNIDPQKIPSALGSFIGKLNKIKSEFR